MLSGEALVNLLDPQYPCRTLQIRQLSALLDPGLPSPPSIVLYGLEATGKSLITRAVLEASCLTYSWVACNESITARHLTERIAAAVKEVEADAVAVAVAQEQENGIAKMRAENINALSVVLRKVLGTKTANWNEGSGQGQEQEKKKKKHVLVLDRIDKQREATPILLAGLGRLGEIIPCLTIIFILSVPSSRAFSTSAIPHIHFPPYTKTELITILCKNPLRLHIPPSNPPSRSPTPETKAANDEADLVEDLFVYSHFLGTVWESLAKSTSRNILQFKAITDKMWDEFVEPIRSGEYGTRNFSQLYVRQRNMFRMEHHILDEVVPRGEQPPSNNPAQTPASNDPSKLTHDLPYYSKFLLMASYLASYNPARQDVQFFMKSTDRRRRRRGGGGGGGGPLGGGGGPGRKSQVRKIPRRLLGPQPFLLERLFAIFHALVPDPVPSSVDLQTQVATLTSLRLLVRASVGGDPLEPAAKWRVNVGWEYIHRLARSVKFQVEEYLAEV